jgi:subtilase family serine protease
MNLLKKAQACLLVLVLMTSVLPASSSSEDGIEPVNDGGMRPLYDDTLDLVVWRTDTPIAIDGVIDSKWTDALPLKTFVQGNSSVLDIFVSALFDDNYIYILAQWDEPLSVLADVDRDAWSLKSNSTPGTWEQKDWGEDRLSFIFEDPNNPVANFSIGGCDAVCHNLNDMFTRNPGEMLDVWVWSAATTNEQSYADDGYLTGNNSVTIDNRTMHNERSDMGWDPGTEGWIVNEDFSGGVERPSHVWDPSASPSDLSFMFESDAVQVDWGSYNISTLPVGEFVPGHVLKTPSGDRADVEAKGVHNGTSWNVEFKRARASASTWDIPFTDTNTPIYFSLSMTDNKTGEDHSKAVGAYALWLADPEVPDLVVSTITPLTSAPTVNSTLETGIYMENIGWASAGVSRYAYYWDDEAVPEGHVVVSALDWGKSNYTRIEWDTSGLAPGNHTLKVVGDIDDAVSEIFEDNNELTHEIELMAEPLPDLVFEDLKVAPHSAPEGAMVQISAIGANIGDLDATGVEYIFYFDDPGTPLERATIPVDAGARENLMWMWEVDLPVGNYTLNATLDPDDSIREHVESNNNMSVPFNVTEPTLPDLTVVSLTPLSPSVTQGRTTSALAVIENIGGADASAGLEVALYLDEPFTMGTVGQVATCSTAASLEVGGIWNATLTWTVPIDADIGSDHFLRAHVDWLGVVEELDESNNNVTYDSLLVLEKPRPDLIIQSVSPTILTGKLESVINITVIVKNDGNVTSSETTLMVQDETHDDNLTTIIVPELGAGNTTTLFFEWQVLGVPLGELSLLFIVDPIDLIEEQHELNNVERATLTVQPADKADLVVDGVAFTPTEPRLGDPVTISVTVSNNGTTASTTTNVELRLGNNRIGLRELAPLGVGENRTVDMAWAATEIMTASNFFVRIIVDPDNQVRELNESNNELMASITFVEPPQAVLTNLTMFASSSKVDEGKEVTFTITLENTGDIADTVTIVLKDGTEEVDSKQAVVIPAGGNKTETFVVKLKGKGAHEFVVTIYKGSDIVKDPDGLDLEAVAQVEVKKKDENPGFGAFVAGAAVIAALAAMAVRRRR